MFKALTDNQAGQLFGGQQNNIGARLLTPPGAAFNVVFAGSNPQESLTPGEPVARASGNDKVPTKAQETGGFHGIT